MDDSDRLFSFISQSSLHVYFPARLDAVVIANLQHSSVYMKTYKEHQNICTHILGFFRYQIEFSRKGRTQKIKKQK